MGLMGKEESIGKINRKVELLAPAGNAEGFYGAIHAGADAVYLAGDKFGARAYAENFTTEVLVECIRYAHLLGRKVYLTVNTLLKEEELSGLYCYLRPFYEAGLDAVIVQDLGVFRFIREHFPGLKLHVSTQMAICSGYGAAMLKELGASRIVPARELSLGELAAMKRQADIEIEAFVHGAMCYCYSGQCLFSSILGGRSGNRGRCAQPCRLPYSVSTGGAFGKECYPLSLKDMCTIEHIPKLIEAGIDSFKIEGRMKKPEYAAGVTAIYRRYIDAYYAAKSYHVEKEDLEMLRSLYIRSEIQDGYYFRHNGREMVTLESPAYKGSDEQKLSEIREKYIAVKEKLPVHVKALFRVGHPAEVVYTWQGESCRVTGEMVEQASRQPVTPENIKKQLGKLGDSAFYAEGMEVEADPDCFYPLKQINELRRAAVAGLEEQILAARGYSAVSCDTEVVQDDVPKRKTDSAGYVFSISTLPQLEAVLEWFCNVSDERSYFPLRFYIEGDLFLAEREAVLAVCRKLPAGSSFFLALPYILRESDRNYLERLSAAMEESGIFCGFLARSMDGAGFVRQLSKQVCCRTDAGVYAWNRQAVRELASLAEGFCLPYELNEKEQKGLPALLSCEKVVYGRIPMMLTANCQFRTFGQCQKNGEAANKNKKEPASKKCSRIMAEKQEGAERQRTILKERQQAILKDEQQEMLKDQQQAILKDGQQAIFEDRYYAVHKDRYHATLKDRYRRDFPVVANCLHCMNIIYNSVPLSLYQSLSRWKGRADLRMDFTLETPKEVKALLDAFLKGAAFPLKEYTTGHEKRGVE